MVIFLVPGSVNGLNLYAYCGNNPFMYKQGPALGGSTVVSSFIAGGSIERKLSKSKSLFNLFGAELRTSFGWDTDLGNGSTRTYGFTIGINTGCLVAAVYWVYKFLKTGDPSPVPGLQPLLSY